MADNEEAEEHLNKQAVPKTAENEEGTRVNDWEVVTLTASAYAAAPGPRGDELNHDNAYSTLNKNEEAETSRDLFMSGHFAFPPSQHENLPIMPDSTEPPKGDEEKDFERLDEERGIKELDVTGDEVLESNEPTVPRGLNVDLYGTPKHDPLQSTTGYDESADENDLDEASDYMTDSSYISSRVPESGKKDEADDSELPCGAWWKRGVASLCAQAQETSAFWSIFVAAAVMGLVVLGQRWQLSVGDEKSGRILSRLKDVVVGGNRRGT